MKTAEEIFEDARKSEDIPNYHNILEINCFMALRILLQQFYNKNITQEQAAKQKNKVFAIYEKDRKEYEFKQTLFKESIDNTEKVMKLRTLLREQLKEQDNYTIDMALTLIDGYMKERWNI